jgi:predicted glycogen debranching enzyme
MISFDRKICGELASATQLEWLETNGLGGYAGSTIAGLNTRRYHGLLVAATPTPVDRFVLLSKLEEILIVDGTRYELSSNAYPGVTHPRGFEFLSEFRLDPYPIFTFTADGLTLEKHVCMVHGENTVVVQYKLQGRNLAKRKVSLDIRPLIAYRDYHSTTHENTAINGNFEQGSGLVSLAPYHGMPPLHLAHNATTLQAEGSWYRNFQFAREMERGLDFQEDLFNPMTLAFDLGRNKSAVVIASTEQHAATEADALISKEIKRRKKIADAAPVQSDLGRALSIAADQFLVKRGEQYTVIAGYPWFGDWGRDTMIALPGLTLATGRLDVAKSILLEFSKHVSEGMLPNRFPEAGTQPEYNTVDATLWYFEAVRAYLEAGGDKRFVRENLYPVLVEIINWHVKGTRYGIYMEEGNGLLHAGEPGVQLTWMDAKIDDWVVTPRIGKPVEVQALWFNALRIMADLAQGFADEPSFRRFDRMATVAQWSFNKLFWNESTGCLFDVVNGGPPDGSIRPNQILAVSLHHSMLPRDKAQKIVEKVQAELFTLVGLRTLPASDPRYIGKYFGDQRARDAAYHQGTVWPWLLGPFFEAYLKVHQQSPAALTQVGLWLNAFESHLQTAGLGQVSEIFDADAPHAPAGCTAQAWSVAELLRVQKMIARPMEKRAAAISYPRRRVATTAS